MSAMMEIQFPPQYRYAKYVPFDKSIVPDDLLYDILLSNNQYQSETRRKVISGLTNIETRHPTLHDSNMSLREWLMSIQNPHNKDFIFEHVEASNDDIAVIYPTTYDDTVKDFLNQITEHMRSHFSQPNDLLSTSKSLNTRTSTRDDSTIAYGKKLATIFASNPQDPPVTPPKPLPKPKTIYYGAADAPSKTYLNHLTQPKQTSPPALIPPNSQAPKPPAAPVSSNSPNTIQQQIMNRLSKLEKASADVNSKLESKFKEFEAKREADQDKLIHSVTAVVTTSLTSSLPQLIAAQLKVAFQDTEGEKS